ncbi:phage tail spike protein [Bacillus cereus]|uniref:phage tail spike protein n=1 Tax=Bacillus cereus TaxID=1396 RepID=UPI000C284B5F|nr:phage tail spike protein [Bacillus cereus]
MRIPSGILHVVDFKTEQIVANIQPKDYWDDIRHWEIKNNIDTLEFKVFDNTEHAATLIQQNLVLKEVRDGRIVPYVITEAEEDSHDRSVIAYASGEWIQLAKAGIIPPQKLEGKTVMEMVNIALSGTKWKAGNIEYASFRSMTIDEFIDPLSFLKKIASLFELEIQYRAEVVGSQIISRYVDMVKKRGQETGKEVTLGKDLIGIKRVENSQNICTSLVGFVKKEGDTIITVESINNGLPYIVDNDAFQRWNERGQHKFGFYTPETEEDITPQRLMTLMKTELAKRVNTSVVYEVQAQSIGRVFGLAHELINEGDTIRIKDTGFTPKLYLEARAIAGDESFIDPSQDKYVFGDYREIVDPNEELRKIYNRILSSLGNKQEMINQLDELMKETAETAKNAQKESEAAKKLAEKVQEDIKNNTVEIIESTNPPTNDLKDRKTLWLDISNGKPGILKLWKNGIWDPVVLDTAPLQQNIKDAENDINTLKETVKDMPDKNWLSQQLENKADKSGVYTKDYIDQNLIGKQIYETDKEGNTQKFTDLRTDVNRNAVELSNKAEKTEVTQLGEDLTSVKQTVNTVKQTAEENTSTITKLESSINNENHLYDSSANNVRPKFVNGNDSVPSHFYQTIQGYENDYSWMTCTNWSDSFFQVGDYLSDNLRGFDVGKDITLSMDLSSECPFVEIMIFQYVNGQWTVPTNKFCATTTSWKRESYTFKLDKKCKGWMFRIRFDAKESSKDKKIWFRNLKLEKGSFATPWLTLNASTHELNRQTNEIKQTVDSNIATISKVQKDQGAMQSTLNEVKQTAKLNSQSISTLTQTQTQQGQKITETNSKLEQQATAIEAKVGIKQVEDYVGGFQIPELKNTVTKNKQDLLDEISKKVATEGYNTKVTELERLISANAQGISLAAVKTEIYTRTESDNRYADKAYVERQAARIDLTEKAITSTVQKGDIISAINQTAEQITIDVSKLNINADTVVKWLTAKGIDADVIKISGDKVTIDRNGITVKMANFLYEDEFGKKYSVMPKKNLIADHMFSSISCYLPTNNMRRIQHSPEWRITGEPYIEDNYTDFGYEQMINAMRINIQHWIRYPLFSGVKRGKKYTLSAHFRAATYNGNVVSDYPRLRVITGHYAPDGRPVEDLRFEKAYDAPGRNIVRYSNTFTIPDNFPDNGFCYFDIYGAGDYGSNMAVCVSGVQLVEGDLPAVYNWDTTIDNIASGYTPVQSLSIGNRDTFLGYGVTSPEFRINTNADVYFNRKISTYGVNVGGQPFGSYGSIFYVNGASGWSFYTMGIDGNWKTWNGI